MKNFIINFNSNALSKPLKVVRGTILGTALMSSLLFSGCTKDQELPEPTSYVVNIDTIKKGNDSISLFNVGNYEVKGESNLKDIKKANKKGIPCGFIVNTIASNRAEMYNDVEYVKYIIEKSEVYCPVYLNIDLLINNNMLRVDEMLDLISVFASKLTENKILVGVCGIEYNIKKLVENDENNILKAYDVFLLDNDTSLDVESSVSSMIKTDEDGNYVTYENFSNICKKKNLNNRNNFLCDRVHEVKDGETLADIAFSYGLSVNDLLEYNECSSDEIPEFLRIPSVSQNKIISNFEMKHDSEYAFGLDISACQNNIDWDLLSERYDFMILKATWHTNVADKFEEYSAECSLRDIPYGVYFANYVSHVGLDGNERTSEQMKNAQMDQIDVALKSISNKNVTLPAFLDFEDFDGNTNFASNYKDYQCVAMLDVWYERLTNAGYIPGIYCDETRASKLINAYDTIYGKGSLEKKFKMWISGDITYSKYGYYYKSDINYEDALKIYNEVGDNLFDVEGIDADMVQPSDHGLNFGAGDVKGYTDYDFAKSENIFPNYEIKGIDNINYNPDLVETKIPKQKGKLMYKLGLETNKSYILGLATGVFASVDCLGAAYVVSKIINKRKKVKRYTK